MPENSLLRFHEAQKDTFADALNEIRAGKKNSHWMWFIFPQLAGLGLSPISRHYAIRDLKEAESFLQDNVLAERLKTLSKALMEVTGRSAREIFGSPDDLKLRSSMTLFSERG